ALDFRLLFGLRKPAQVDQRQIESRIGLERLVRLAVCKLDDGSQRLMPIDERLERATQGVFVERASQAPWAGSVVHERSRLELVDEPHQLLRVGQRGRAVLAAATDRRR